MLDVISVFQTCIQKCCQRCNTESESKDLRYIVKRKRSWGVYNRLMSPNLDILKMMGKKRQYCYLYTQRIHINRFSPPLFF